MSESINEAIVSAISEYLNLGDMIAHLKARQDEIKAELQREMDALETDQVDTATGTARVITRAASVSFPSLQVYGLAKVWVASSDPILSQCGELLMTHKQDRPASTYVRISKPK